MAYIREERLQSYEWFSEAYLNGLGEAISANRATFKSGFSERFEFLKKVINPLKFCN